MSAKIVKFRKKGTKAKKPAAKSRKPTVTAEPPKRGAIGQRIRELVATRADLSPAEIAEIVREEFPGSSPTRASVSCYFTYLRQDLKGPQPARDSK